ncbi:FeoA family protein [Chlorobium phaeovibrioides]|uniref:FeoA family protein n=1 Tax=Chlorobium phaeovibrioides TaxID=1094 RepID=UPI001FD3286F|nr:ferrous iron transport protein A [Chlorobium phaeovibrioides]
MIVPLGMLHTGESAEIIGFRRAQGGGGPLSCNNGTGRHQHGGRGPGHGRLRDGSGQERRLSELGFSSGQVVEVVQNDRGVPVLLKVRDGRMAIDHAISMEIIVRRKTQ